jgi:PadR family transcriptional regulator PadR
VRRLEEQGLLTSEWNTEESRPRKFYRTSEEGESMLRRLLDDLAAVQTSMTGLIEGADR